jgi:hypothetical protein
MFKLEDMDEFSFNIAKAYSKEGSVIVHRLETGNFAIIPGIKKDNTSVISTESGLILSKRELDDWEGTDYIFIHEGSLDKEK